MTLATIVFARLEMSPKFPGKPGATNQLPDKGPKCWPQKWLNGNLAFSNWWPGLAKKDKYCGQIRSVTVFHLRQDHGAGWRGAAKKARTEMQ